MKHKNIFLFYLSLLILNLSSVYAVQSIDDTTHYDSTNNKKISLIEDSPVITMLDSISNSIYFKKSNFITDISILNVYHFPSDSIPVYSDSVYKYRIEQLNKKTPFDLVYNETVRRCIDLYTIKKRKSVSRILGLAQLYFPLFEEQLDKYNLPLELKYLAMIESALNPVARSRSGASGLWQFMYRTGKLYNLKTNSYIDDRFDPYKSTVAACEHLSDLYNIYHDWVLVIAAYNSGSGNVNKAIRRSNGNTDFWKIERHLPRETRTYVPIFIAAVYVMNYAAEHNIYPRVPDFMDFEVDTVIVKKQLSFDQISEMLNIPYQDIEFLNPTYKIGYIPANDKKDYILRLPKNCIGLFINNEDSLYNYRTEKQIAKEEYAKKHNIKLINGELFSKHIVRRGETLGGIAHRYGCSVRDIKNWNNIRRHIIHPRQKLLVQVSMGKKTLSNADEKPSVDSTGLSSNPPETDKTMSDKNSLHKQNNKETTSQKTNLSQKNIKYIYVTIRDGDTLWDIANKYKALSVKEIKKLNNIHNVHKLKPGQKIKVGVIENI